MTVSTYLVMLRKLGQCFVTCVSSSALGCDCTRALGFGGFVLKTPVVFLRAIPLLLAFRKIWLCLGSAGLQWGRAAGSGSWSTFCGISVSYLQSKWVVDTHGFLGYFSLWTEHFYRYVFFWTVKWERISGCSRCYWNLYTKVYSLCGCFD